MRKARWALAAALLLVIQAHAQTAPRIAIIIDDLGYQYEAGRRAINLPGAVSYAVLPKTPRGAQLAELAHARGKDVLLHLPLEAVERGGADEPGGIRLDMSRSMFSQRFAEALESVPHAIGVSSHRGSLLTRHPGHMTWLMDEISRLEALFFVDSYTTPDSVALRIAAEAGVLALKRDVFLDHERSKEAISAELERLKELARENGHAVGIGHPFPETLDVLEKELPRLGEHGFELVAISDLVPQARNRARAMLSNHPEPLTNRQ